MSGYATDRRIAILATALGVLKEHGAEGMTTGAIAAAAGCSKATIYGLFASKEGLLLALADEQARAAEALLRRRLAGVDSPTERLARAASLLLDLATGQANLAILRAAAGDRRLGQAMLPARRDRVTPFLEAPIRAMAAAGTLGNYPVGEILETFEGLLLGNRSVRALLGDPAARPRAGEFDALAAKAVERLARIFPPAAA